MKNLHLSSTGLSMSQAQSISNICNQKCLEIEKLLNSINNYSTQFSYADGIYTEQEGIKLEASEIITLLKKKAMYHGLQAFLMENIKEKEERLNFLTSQYNHEIQLLQSFNGDLKLTLNDVDENWAWEQLSPIEWAEYWKSEAYAAHIGKFIHKNGKLNSLRNEIVTLPSVKFISLEEGKKIPMNINKHYTSDELLALYEELANLHSVHESRVNYYKAKVKNLVTLKNLEINSENKKIREENEEIFAKWRAETNFKVTKLIEVYNKQKQELVQMRIKVDTIYQPIINEIKEGISLDSAEAE